MSCIHRVYGRHGWVPFGIWWRITRKSGRRLLMAAASL